ncbi:MULTISPECIES: MBL fold metallo-hydrolase [unclassified Streptomyces]|jgi:glyoxylase-like metal-dependent hydrolase (beta-lactamase superfamily II)|uniref:MBL fold metallo-hydrolase n=1 Tax=unclassified Streptomyces TaxID=2593676 RepID=UPI0033A7D709
MSYTGEVQAGGPGDTRETTDLVITKISVGEIDNNVYLLRCRATGEQLLIDAAAEPRTLLDLIGDGGLATVFTTHQHWDHHRALADVVAATGARSLVGRDDAPGVPVADVLVDDGDTVRAGAVSLTAIHLVGHSPGSTALLYRDPNGHPHLFTGDSLFPGGIGNTEKDPARFASLLQDVETKIFAELPDDTWIYPGHGKDTTLGAERPSLPRWRERGW